LAWSGGRPSSKLPLNDHFRCVAASHGKNPFRITNGCFSFFSPHDEWLLPTLAKVGLGSRALGRRDGKQPLRYAGPANVRSCAHSGHDGSKDQSRLWPRSSHRRMATHRPYATVGLSNGRTLYRRFFALRWTFSRLCVSAHQTPFPRSSRSFSFEADRNASCSSPSCFLSSGSFRTRRLNWFSESFPYSFFVRLPPTLRCGVLGVPAARVPSFESVG